MNASIGMNREEQFQQDTKQSRRSDHQQLYLIFFYIFTRILAMMERKS